MSGLFDPLQMGGLLLENRILMAPMTRGRARANGIPTIEMAEYYARRADAGLIITEAMSISPEGRGWCYAPSLYSEAHIAGWQVVTDAVKRSGGRIFAQLWFVGRVSHPDFLEGRTPIGPSALRANQLAYTYDGKKDCVVPRAMSIEDIRSVVADYGSAAKRALEAGFDGVQIHAANGYLPDQFLRDGSNHRIDSYGGSPSNRLRFLREIVQSTSDAIGASRVSVRLSTRNEYNDMHDSSPMKLFETAAAELSSYGLAFLEVMEALPGHFLHFPGKPILPKMRKAYKGVLVANGGYDRASAERAIGEGQVDAISFGIPFLANCDAVRRMKMNAPFNAANPATFYTLGEPGYLDYPTLEQTGGRVADVYRALSLDEAKRH